jgi:hypothetical protein
MDVQDTRRLLDLIGRKHDCLTRLREHGLRQQELIETGEMTQLLGLLAVKQRELNELHDLETQLNPFRDQDPDRRRWSSDAERLRCASLAEQAARLLREILDCEKRCEESLQRRRDETAVQLAAVQTAGMARGAYAGGTNDYSTSTLDLTTES